VSVEDKNWEASRDLLVQLMEEQEKPPSPVMQGKRRRLLHKLAGLNQSTSTLGTATPVHQAKSKKRGKP
jgi:hypothetical protein